MLIHFGNDMLYNGEWFRLLSFVIITQSISIGEQIIGTTGDRLSGDQQNAISFLKKGDKIHFDEIRATCGDCTIRVLSPFTITIR